MRISRLLVLAAAVGSLLTVPAVSEAQSRGRAVPRGSVRPARPPAVVRPYYRPPYVYRPGVSLGFYYGYPWYVGPSLYGYGGYGYGYGYPYSWYGGYPASPYYGRPPAYYYRTYGGFRIALPQRDAEVYVDGYYAGVVDDFDGNLQQVNLEPGPHHLEVRAEGFEPAEFDVNVEPGRTITYRTVLRPDTP
jgi:hypothetical protein